MAQRKKKTRKNPDFSILITFLKPQANCNQYSTLLLKIIQPLQPLDNSSLSSVGIQHYFDRISDQNFDPVHPHLSREVCQNFFLIFRRISAFIFYADPKQSTRQRFNNSASDSQQFFIF